MKTLEQRILMLPDFNPETMKDDGVTDIFYNYTDELYAFLRNFYDLKIIDINSPGPSKRYPKIKDKDLDQLNIEELILFLDWHFYGERFSAGVIATIIKNGKLDQAVKRLKKLAKEELNKL